MKAITITLLCLFLANMAFAGKAKTSCPADGSDESNEMIMAQADLYLENGGVTNSCFLGILQERKAAHRGTITNTDLVVEMRASAAKALMGQWREGI